MKPSMLSLVAALAGTLALPPTVLAQATTPSAPAAGDTAHSAPAPEGRRQEQVEHRIADLHSRLHITDAQAPAWNQFAQVMRDNARNMDQTFEQRSKRVNEMSALDNMQSYAQLAEEHAQDVQKLVGAFQTLYEGMSPEQKRSADQLFRNYTERGQARGMGPRG